MFGGQAQAAPQPQAHNSFGAMQQSSGGFGSFTQPFPAPSPLGASTGPSTSKPTTAQVIPLADPQPASGAYMAKTLTSFVAGACSPSSTDLYETGMVRGCPEHGVYAQGNSFLHGPLNPAATQALGGPTKSKDPFADLASLGSAF